MTISEFNSLKVGDGVYLPNNRKREQYTSTEVLEIDRIYKKIKVVLKGEWTSYRYFPLNIDLDRVSCFVGTCPLPLWMKT